MTVILVATACSGISGPRVGGPEPAAGTASPQPEGQIVVDLAATHQVIDGFGISERVWADPHLSDSPMSEVPHDAQGIILDALFKDLGLTRMRAVLDPARTEAEGRNYGGKRADGHVELAKAATARGLRTTLATPVGLEPWMREDIGAYVDWAVAMLERWRTLGAELAFYSPVNEPAIAGNLPAEWLVEVVARLGPRIRDAGLRTRLVLPDDLNPATAFIRSKAVLDDDRARPFVAALAFHLYDDLGAVGPDLARMRDLAASHGLPVWMTEYSENGWDRWPRALEWPRLVHRLLTEANASAIDYLWGFFGSQHSPHTLISMRMDRGRYRDHTLQATYYLTGQYSRHVMPGCIRVDAGSEVVGLLPTAFRCPDASLVVVVVNPGPDDQGIRVAVSGGRPAGDVSVTRTSEGEDGVGLEPVPADPSGFDVSLAAQSVTTFVSRFLSS